MLLQLIFTVILNNITHARTHARTHKIPSSRAPVGAKNMEFQEKNLPVIKLIHNFWLLWLLWTILFLQIRHHHLHSLVSDSLSWGLEVTASMESFSLTIGQVSSSLRAIMGMCSKQQRPQQPLPNTCAVSLPLLLFCVIYIDYFIVVSAQCKFNEPGLDCTHDCFVKYFKMFLYLVKC